MTSHKVYVDIPKILSATSSDMQGEIDLVWEPVKGAKSYVIQRRTMLKKRNHWKQEDIVTRPNCTVSKLKSGLEYGFRIAAVGSKGQSQWSRVVHKKAP